MVYEYFDQQIRSYLIEQFKQSSEVLDNDEIIDMMANYFSPAENEFFVDTIEKTYDSLFPNSKEGDEDEHRRFELPRRSRRKNAALEKQLEELKAYPDAQRKIRNKFLDFIEDQKTQAVPTQKVITECQQLFKLSENEVSVLVFFVNYEYSSMFQRYCDAYLPSRRFDHVTLKKLIAKLLNIKDSTVNSILSIKSKLITYGLVEKNRSDYRIDEVTFNLLMDGTELSLISKYVKPFERKDAWAIESFQLSQSKIQTLISILEIGKPCNILLYGCPGSGKTELANSVSKLLKLPLFSMNVNDEEGLDDSQVRKKSLVAIQNHPSMENAIVVVDECDSLINNKINFSFFGLGSSSRKDDKAWINEYFDHNQRQMIWISNSIENVDDSLIRRFDFVLPFTELSSAQRESILKNLIEINQGHFLSNEDIQNLSIAPKITTGHFARALSKVSQINADNAKKRVHFYNIINEYQAALAGTPINLKKLVDHYSIEGLNVDQDPTEVIEFCQSVVARMKLDEHADINLNILLSGPPGSGKTEFAKFLAKSLGKELVLKRASDLLSQFVGVSEKLIKKTFLEAQSKGHILFIDEADSLLMTRESAVRSWEITQVNEILTCMENFKGILICATNFEDKLDSATKRRFLFKLKFDYLKPEGIEHFYYNFFDSFNLGPLDESSRLKLIKLKGVTPSDFYTLKRKFDLVTPKDHQQILESLLAEVSHKAQLFKKKIGVSD